MDASQWIPFLFILGMCASFVHPSPYFQPMMHRRRTVQHVPAPAKVVHIHHIQSGSSSGGSRGHGYYKPRPSYMMHDGEHHSSSSSGHHDEGGGDNSLINLLILSSVLGNNGAGGGLFGPAPNQNNNNLLPVLVAGGLG